MYLFLYLKFIFLCCVFCNLNISSSIPIKLGVKIMSFGTVLFLLSSKVIRKFSTKNKHFISRIEIECAFTWINKLKLKLSEYQTRNNYKLDLQSNIHNYINVSNGGILRNSIPSTKVLIPKDKSMYSSDIKIYILESNITYFSIIFFQSRFYILKIWYRMIYIQ